MTFAKPNLFALPVIDSVLRRARSVFFSPEFPEVRPLPPQRDVAAPPLVPPTEDQLRQERLREKEQDRQILTEVEQHDTEMLDRVRAALYGT